MFKYFILILFTISINGEFVKSVFLENAKLINFINIGKQSIKINKTILEDVIIFSEVRQDMFLGSFILKNPANISSFRVKYLDSYGNNKNKLVYVNKGSVLNRQLYFYEKGDYLYSNNEMKSKIHTKAKIKKKTFYEKENLIFEENLPIAYFDNDISIDILFKKCNDNNEACDNIKFHYWDARVIFYFNFKTRNDKEINLSDNLKRIQIANKEKDKYPTWLIIEANEKIEKIEKIDSDDEKEIKYRIYLD